MKTRFIFSAFCMLVAITMATDAFAQAGTFQVSSGATQGRMNGHTEMAGGVTLALTSGSITQAQTGEVVIDYGVPITNSVGGVPVAVNGGGAVPPDNNIMVSICEQNGRETTDTNAKVDGNTITITVDDGTACTGVNTAAGSIDVSGVRLSLVGSGFDRIDASVTSTGAVRLLGGANTLTVINSIVDELIDDGIEVDDTVTLIRHTGKIDKDDPTKFKLLIMENTVRSFQNAQINLEFSGIPDDVEVTIDAWVAPVADLEDDDDDNDPMPDRVLSGTGMTATNKQLSINDEKTIEAVITAEDNEASVLTGMLARVNDEATTEFDESDHVGGMLSESERDAIIVLGSINLGNDDNVEALLPLNLDIQVTVDVGPIGVTKPKGDQTRSIPRFASDKTTAVTVIESSSAQTVMEVAYVLSDGTFDTGIAVSNMTKDQAGAAHFKLYMNGQEVLYSTPMMMPRTTMSILLSQLLTAAGHTGSFSGQMIITADFTAADAGVFISDFSGFTSSASVRIVP